jgi:hypothetical protein
MGLEFGCEGAGWVRKRGDGWRVKCLEMRRCCERGMRWLLKAWLYDIQGLDGGSSQHQNLNGGKTIFF